MFKLLQAKTILNYGGTTSFLLYFLTAQQVAKDFYNDKFKAGDNRRTFSILDSLKTKDDLTRLFYIFLVSKMLNKADGALSEEWGLVCK